MSWEQSVSPAQDSGLSAYLLSASWLPAFFPLASINVLCFILPTDHDLSVPKCELLILAYLRHLRQ